MIILLVFIVFVIAGATLPSLRLTKKYGNLSWWDVLYPYTGIPVWFALTSLGIGATPTLSNFVVEVILISIVSIAAPWLALFSYRTKNKNAVSAARLLSFLPVVFSIVIRLLLKSLPE